jgi:hypothetical protein
MQGVYQHSNSLGLSVMLAQCIDIVQETRNSENGLRETFQVSSELSQMALPRAWIHRRPP